VSVGEDIGFLPGTEEEKMTPWMGALTDNLEVLTHTDDHGAWGRGATNDLLAVAHQDPRDELHARAHLPQPLGDRRRGAEPHAQADEDADHARRPGHEDHLHGATSSRSTRPT
jgi:hypothetical protein